MNRNSKPKPGPAGPERRVPDKQHERRALFLVWVGIPLAIVAALGLFGYWTYANYFAVWRDPVVRINAATVNMDYFVKLLRIYSTNAGADPSFLSEQVLSDIEDNELVKQGATALQIQVTPDEVTERIKSYFSPPPQAPAPEPTETPAATPGPTPTSGEGTPDPTATPTATETPRAAPTPTPDFDTTYRSFLEDNKLSQQEYRVIVEIGLLRQKVIDYLEERNVPADGPQVHLNAIVVDMENADSVLSRLRNGEDFAAVAKELSQDPGAQDNGGDLGWMPKGIFPQLDNVAFSIDVNVVSDPIVISQMVYVIMITEKADSRPIGEPFRDTLASKEFDKWLSDQRKAAKIQEYLDSAKTTWAVNKVLGKSTKTTGG